MACLDDETATAYLRGDLDPEEAAHWAAHLAECEICRQCVQDVSALIDSVRQDLMLSSTDVSLDVRGAARVMQRAPARRQAAQRSWLQPRFVSASVVTAAALVLLMVWLRGTPLSAAEAVRRASVAEQAASNDVTQIIHRTLTIEERRPQGREPLRSQRVEIWQNGADRTRVRRLYDESGRLLAGEWTRRDGTRAVYERAKAPVIDRVGDRLPLDSANAWRWEPSIQPFIQATDDATLSLARDAGRETYTLTSASVRTGATGVIPVQLTLSARDFRPLAQTLAVHRDGDTREFVLREAEFEALPRERVEPARFVPDPELLLPSRALAVPSLAVPVSASAAPRVAAAWPAAAAPRSLDPIAMHTLFLLHGLGLTLGGEVSLDGTSGDRLGVQVTVSSDLRRIVVLQRLAPLLEHGAVTVDVRVRDDDVRPAPVAARPWEATPTYQRMRERVLAQLTGPDAGTTAGIVTTETIRWMLNESAQIRARAGTLARFSEEWPSDRLDRLDLDALAEWQTIVRDHAVDVGQRAETLRDRVAAFLPPGSAPAPLPAVDALTGPSDAERLIRRLSELASLQQTVLTAALSVGAPPPPEIRTSHLDEALTHLVAIAAVFASPWPLSR